MKNMKNLTVLQFSKYCKRFIVIITSLMILMFVSDIIKSDDTKLSPYFFIVFMIVLAKIAIYYIKKIEKEYIKLSK